MPKATLCRAHGWGTALGLLALLALGSAHALPAASQFAVTERTLYLSGDSGNTAGRSGVLLLVPQAPSQQGQEMFLAPGVSALGLVSQPANQTWYSLGPWDQDLEVVDDATALLYFTANPQASPRTR